MEDFEVKSRFYHKRDLVNGVRPHMLGYRVWYQSMSLRYNIEMLFFMICVFVFQYFISSFNTDMHALDTDLYHLEYFHIIEILDDGHIITIDELRNHNRELDMAQRSQARQLSEVWETEEHGSCLKDTDLSWVTESRKSNTIWTFLR